MDGRKALAVSLLSIGLFLAVVILAVGALRGNWPSAWLLVVPLYFLLIEPGGWLLLAHDGSADRTPLKKLTHERTDDPPEKST
jgi:hypothetical protein